MAFIQFIKTIECAQSVYNTQNFMQVLFFLTGLALKLEATAVATDEIGSDQKPLYSRLID